MAKIEFEENGKKYSLQFLVFPAYEDSNGRWRFVECPMKNASKGIKPLIGTLMDGRQPRFEAENEFEFRRESKPTNSFANVVLCQM